MGYKTGAYGSMTALLNKVATLASGGMDFIGFAYNIATDNFIRLGAAQGIPNGQPLPMNISPLLSNLRMVTLADNGSVYKEISWIDKTKYTDGATVSYDGSQGQVTVELWNKTRTNYTPYMKVYTYGTYYFVLFSHLPLDGYTIIPGASGYSAGYMGAFEASVYNSGGGNKLYSIAKSPADGTSDVYPVTERSGDWGLTGTNQSQMDALAAARGTGWLSGDWLIQEYYTLLMMCVFGTYDVPGTVGAGRINLSGGTWTNGSYVGKCGLSIASTYPYFSAVQAGTTSGYATDYSFVLGVENPWGNIWTRISGVLVNNGAFYYKSAPPYDYTTTTGWTRLTDVDGNGVTLPISNGYGGRPQSGRAVMLPKDVTGSSSTRMRDYYNYSAGARVLLVGGHSFSGPGAGPFCWYADYAASDAYSFVGGRLCFKKSE